MPRRHSRPGNWFRQNLLNADVGTSRSRDVPTTAVPIEPARSARDGGLLRGGGFGRTGAPRHTAFDGLDQVGP